MFDDMPIIVSLTFLIASLLRVVCGLYEDCMSWDFEVLWISLLTFACHDVFFFL